MITLSFWARYFHHTLAVLASGQARLIEMIALRHALRLGFELMNY
jgi:hypothetical protein